MSSTTFSDSDANIADIKHKYHALFEPSSVAIVGASPSPLKWGFRILLNTKLGGYKGALYAVNPKHKEIIGIECFPTVRDIPGELDLAVIVLPPQFVLESIRECAGRGVRACVVITAGFGETKDSAAHLSQEEMARIARDAGMLLVGPNCAGIASPDPHSLYSGMLYRYPKSGGFSLVSQSGNVGMTVLTWAELHQVGVARFVSSGNEAVLRSEDFIHFFGLDTRTKAILAYVEGTTDGRRFFNALRETTKHKPVVVVKGGTTSAGQQAANSHTGALAGPTQLFVSACRQAGANVAEDFYQAMELTSAFVNQQLPRGRRVVIVSEGGGWGVIGADACAAAGLDVIPLPESVLQELDTILPGWWSRGNPIDLVAGNDRTMMTRAIECVLKCPEVDAVLVLGVGYMSSRAAEMHRVPELVEMGMGKLIDAACDVELHEVRKINSLIDLYGKPVIVASDTVLLAYGATPNAAIREMERLGVYAYSSPHNAAHTLENMAERYEYLNNIPRK